MSKVLGFRAGYPLFNPFHSILTSGNISWKELLPRQYFLAPEFPVTPALRIQQTFVYSHVQHECYVYNKCKAGLVSYPSEEQSRSDWLDPHVMSITKSDWFRKYGCSVQVMYSDDPRLSPSFPY